MEREGPPLLRPTPYRPFDTSTPSPQPNPSPNRTSDFASQLEAKLRQSRRGSAGEHPESASTPTRTRSNLNLTSSTLFGIYQPTEREDCSEPQTPWGTGAETPLVKDSKLEFPSVERVEDRPRSPNKQAAEFSPVAQGLRMLALFVFGVSYGIIIQHLHDQRNVAPVNLGGLNRKSWDYLVFWGLASVGWGMMLPWFDLMWEPKSAEPLKGTAASMQRKDDRAREGMEFLQVARIIGGFIGIAFAARKLAWRSTLQASLTLSLVNPALWYLFDRTKSGFTLSLIIGLLGTLALLAINPDMLPAPGVATQDSTFLNGSTSATKEGSLIAGVISYESIGVATWIASVLFCSCICFGNIGRRLSGWVKEG